MTIRYNEDLEFSFISCMIKDGSTYGIVEDLVKREYLNNPTATLLYDSIKDVYRNEIFPDRVTVMVDLQNKEKIDGLSIISKGIVGKDVIDYVMSLDVNPENIESYAFQISNLYARKKFRLACQDALKEEENNQDLNTMIGNLDIHLGKLSTLTGSVSKNVKSIEDVAIEGAKQLKNAMDNKHLFISTGLSAWDDYTNGLFPKRLYIVAARSSDGKSSLVQNIAYNLSIEGKTKVQVFTFESENVEFYNKLIQRITGIPVLRIEKGTLTDDEVEKYGEAYKKLKNSPYLSLDDSSGVTLPLLKSKIRKAVGNGAQLIIIDQLENIILNGNLVGNEEHIKLNYLVYRIKDFAKEFNIPIILVHQMNRSIDSGENRGKDKEPQSSDLAQAGEKGADAVLMIRHLREERKIIKSTFYWVKNRQGEQGKRNVEFDGKHILFKDIEGQSEFRPDFIAENGD